MSSVTKRIRKIDLRKHALMRPGMWIGGVKPTSVETRVLEKSLGAEENKFVTKKLKYSFGLVQIISEIICNAFDQCYNGSHTVEINIDGEKISVTNIGSGIDIANTVDGDFAPEIIFLHERTSSNYFEENDEEFNPEEFTSGTNGYGSKLTRIFSDVFEVTTVDKARKLKYHQVFDSFGKVGDAEISPSSELGMTNVTFVPTYKIFELEKLDSDNLQVVERKIFDMAFFFRGKAKCIYNGKIVPPISEEEYAKLFGVENIVTIRQKKWIVSVGIAPQAGFAVSFVNGIMTTSGGTHVRHVLKTIKDAVSKKLGLTKNDKTKIDKIPKCLAIFVETLMNKKIFSSQIKEELTTPPKDFDEKFQFGTVDELLGMGLAELLEVKKRNISSAELKKIDKLNDAEWAGKNPDKAWLILTEGDSATTSVLAGRSAVRDGTKSIAVYSMRGKITNAMKIEKIDDTEIIITTLAKIIGLNTGKLRYHKIIIMTDADYDGSHIKGLIMAAVHMVEPALLRRPGFICCFQTPAVKVFRGNKIVQQFFSVKEFQAWQNSNPNMTGLKIKYYKGLGTNMRNEMVEYFKKLPEHLVEYVFTENTEKMIEMAFGKDSDPRKEWVQRTRLCSDFDIPVFTERGVRKLTYDDFINTELIQFSIASNVRAIPKLMDGLKPVQRKVLYTILKRNVQKEVKLVILAGWIMADTYYHQGDVSLHKTIIKMAQNFAGSNNINLLFPGGAFGSRKMGGKDSASPRYIETRMNELTRLIFREEDDPILTYAIEDGHEAEPNFYLPIIPIALINGCRGMGTGFNTFIPQFNPNEIIDTILDVNDLVMANSVEERVEGEYKDLFPDEKIFTFFLNRPLFPWYRNFRGKIKREANEYATYGTVRKVVGCENLATVTELPVQMWTDTFDQFLREKQINYTNRSTDVRVEFEVDVSSFDKKFIHKELGLRKTLSTSNMRLFDADGKLKYYLIQEQILWDWWRSREPFYVERKRWWIEYYAAEIDSLRLKYDFIMSVIENKLAVSKVAAEIVLSNMAKMFPAKNYPNIKNIVEERKKLFAETKIKAQTKEKLMKLEREIQNIRDKKSVLEKKHHLEIWNDELCELKEKYKIWETENCT